ncbi:hypothetical protein FVB32_05370 [Flagellimonas hymeniacidonis]|uniref:Uncharacterized protein n=1 Tax=Flagellimonas hymeniacidonis TaxID=2603628 RepID=A0A5C8V964_9FLAO|nr:hypothetical protein [Flagellimonas hymeniacidonis]TXN37719.1 hypothetical protein FVB32_05370 [Flagellimonas hymeniacidonis]
MDAHDFEQMTILDQWEYFWDSGEFVDSIRGETMNYFLYRDIEHKDFFMELWIEHNPEGRRGINGLHTSDTVKYFVPHEQAKLPWAIFN